MAEWKDNLVLAAGEKIQHERSYSEGFMGETDIELYTVVGENGMPCGTVKVSEHTAVRGYRKTVSVEQRDQGGQILVQKSWNP